MKKMCKECSTLYDGDACPMCRMLADKPTLPVAELPVNFDDCSKVQLEWMRENGAYGQRMIAERYLRDWKKMAAHNPPNDQKLSRRRLVALTAKRN